MKATIVGLGLIGGSFALGLRKSGLATELIGMDRNADHASQAVALGLVDSIATEEEALKTADLIVLAIPVNALNTFLPHVLDLIKEDAVVLDAGSTKAAICKLIANHPKRNQFVAAHPIAGTYPYLALERE